MKRGIIVAVLLFFLFSTQQSNGQVLSVMSFNIRLNTPADSINQWDFRKKELVEMLQYYQPDFIGFQEVLYDQLRFLDTELKNYSFVGSGRKDGKNKGEFTPVFYDNLKYEVLQNETFWLSENGDTASVGWDAALERICTFGIFREKLSGDTIFVFNTHFDHIGKTARLMSAKLILKKLTEITDAHSSVILTGDFNCNENSDPINELKKVMKDAGEISEKGIYGPVGTFNGFNLVKLVVDRIDFIFVRNFRVLRYRHIDDRKADNLFISDHYPVITDLKAW
ncbi:MAG TPA: endonuclease/exonuclease/phosphatase family protein [Bacteroidales bacterium]|mgnify:CR=1 FL=1|nr:endonuclease/exonuclease/phosphatase family protein [Bacteroidales bacterium]